MSPIVDDKHWCTGCKDWREVTEFYGKQIRCGLASECKKCTSKRNKERRQKYPEVNRAKCHRYYVENPEVFARYRQDYWDKNRDKVLARRREIHKERREEDLTKIRDYYSRYPAKRILYGARKRAKMQGLSCTIVETDILIPEVCPLLGIPLIVSSGTSSPNSPSLDRIDPTRGYTPDNVWVISHKANTIKQDMQLSDLVELGRTIEKILNITETLTDSSSNVMLTEQEGRRC